MRYTLGKKALVRMPLLPYNASLYSSWPVLLSAIACSSNEFWKIISEIDPSQLDMQDPHTRYSLWKYYSRARYRATPFAGFGSITIVPLSPERAVPKLKLSKYIINHRFVDWSQKDKIDYISLMNDESLMIKNGTVYQIGNNFRFYSLTQGDIQIEEVERSELLDAVLTFCVIKKTFKTICSFLIERFDITMQSARPIIRQMVAAQLLFPELSPNIIGQDYFDRAPVIFPNKNYIIAERKLVEGKIASNSLKEMPALITFLSKVLPLNENLNLKKFKQKFLEKYGTEMVPLALALDPILGIGYDAVDSQGSLPVKLHSDRPKPCNDLKYTSFHAFLIANMAKKVIHLEQYEDDPSKEVSQMPNSISALISFSKELTIVSSLGGSTANSILGRFTVINEELEIMAKEIATIEKAANPDVMFFDVGSFEEISVDNINRRKLIYDLELQILGWPTTNDFIPLSDVCVFCHHGEFILRSEKLNKRLIPRIPSSYNYRRSALSVFRFLNDLQHQSLQTDLTFQFDAYLPGLKRYPRVQWRSLVISPAMWQIPKSLLRLNMPTVSKLSLLKNWRVENDIPPRIKSGTSDQLLTFDLDQEQEIHHFLKYIGGKSDLFVYESFEPTDLVQNESGEIYAHQIALNLMHPEKLYKDVKYPYPPKEMQFDSPLLSTGEWIYYAIYLHDNVSNILLTRIARLIRHHLKHMVSGWFFVRYKDPKAHLRIRIKLKSSRSFILVNEIFCNNLKDELSSGLVENFDLRVYFREARRYSAVGIEKAEKYFIVDSQFVLALLDQDFDVPTLYGQIISVAVKVLDAFLELGAQIAFLKTKTNELKKGKRVDVEAFKGINRLFVDMMIDNKFERDGRINEKKVIQYQNKTIALLKQCDPKYQILLWQDFFHMHINRIFYSNQNDHESIIYLLLLKKTQQKYFSTDRDFNMRLEL